MNSVQRVNRERAMLQHTNKAHFFILEEEKDEKKRKKERKKEGRKEGKREVNATILRQTESDRQTDRLASTVEDYIYINGNHHSTHRAPLNGITHTHMPGIHTHARDRQTDRLNDKNANFMPTRERQQPPIMPSFRTNENEHKQTRKTQPQMKKYK